MTIKAGTRVRFSHSHLLQTVTFTATVRKIEGETAWVEMPDRVLALPFPPNGGKRFGLFRIADLVAAK